MFWRQGQRNAAKAGRPAGRRVVVAEQKHARAHCSQGRAASCVAAAAAHSVTTTIGPTTATLPRRDRPVFGLTSLTPRRRPLFSLFGIGHTRIL